LITRIALQTNVAEAVAAEDLNPVEDKILRQFHQSTRTLQRVFSGGALNPTDAGWAQKVLAEEKRSIEKLLQNSAFYSETLKKKLAALHGSQTAGLKNLESLPQATKQSPLIPPPQPVFHSPQPTSNPVQTDFNPFIDIPTIHTNPFEGSSPAKQITQHNHSTNPFDDAFGVSESRHVNPALVYNPKKEHKKSSGGLFIPMSTLETKHVYPVPMTKETDLLESPNLTAPKPRDKPPTDLLMDFGPTPQVQQDPRFDINLI